MKILLLFISFFCFCQGAQANCTYSPGASGGGGGGGGGGGVTVNFSGVKILADDTLPVGSILAAETRGGNVTDLKTFRDCAANDIFVIRSTNDTVANVKGIQNGTVYETGIPGIGYQISDITKGSVLRPIPAKLNDPVPASSKYYSKTTVPGQVRVWLIKTGPITQTTLSNYITAYFLAGAQNAQTQGTGNPNSSQLLRININLGGLQYKNTTCNITPEGGNTVTLQPIDVSQLIATSQGAYTGKQKDIKLRIDCPTAEVGTGYIYWFNPITENSPTVAGVLMNNAAAGAKDVGIIIKQNNQGVKFYDTDTYKISSVQKTQLMTINADYYKFSNNIVIGTGEVQAMFEVILQEK